MTKKPNDGRPHYIDGEDDPRPDDWLERLAKAAKNPARNAERDALIKRVSKFLVEVEELDDEIKALRADHPDYWTPFDLKRNCMALLGIQHYLLDMRERLLLQVGRWPEIYKPGAKWDEIKARIAKKK